MAEFTEDDKKLIEAFKALDVKPKTDTPADLEKWLKDFSTEHGERSTVHVTTSNHQPRLSIFYGDTTTLSKGEATYDQWIYEVRSIMRSKKYKEEDILQAIIRSVKGEAGRIILRLGEEAGLREMLEKLDKVYSGYGNKEALLSKFYSAKQKEDEDLSTWSFRLEDILNKAVTKKIIHRNETGEMLRTMFWRGMKQELKDIYGYKFELSTDFDKFRREVLELEEERLQNTERIATRTTAKSVTEKENKDLKQEVQELKGFLASLTSTVKSMDSKLNNLTAKQDQASGNDGAMHYHREVQGRQLRNEHERCYSKDDESRNPHSSSHCCHEENRQPYEHRERSPQRYRRTPSHYEPRRDNYREDRRYNNRQPRTDRYRYNRDDIDPNSSQGPECYRCRQRGHFQWQCKTRMDHHRLN